MINWILDEVEEIAEINDCDDCEGERRKVKERNCQDCGEGVSREENQYALVGMDAVALFPSLSSKITAGIVRKKVMESTMKCEGFNWKKAAIYILANKHLVGKMNKETRKYFPLRKKVQGVTPGMGSKGLNNKEESEEEQWFYPRKNPSEETVKEMIGMVAQIGEDTLGELLL